jgi:MFS family permease
VVGFLIVAFSAVPGYILAILTMDRLGRKPIQLLGFAMMALTFGAIALFPTVRNVVGLFAVMFGISYFFTEFGPNTTTFLYPAEVFPTRARTTAHGIASGLAKLGAFVGVLLFPLLENAGGLALALAVSACTAALGFVLTALLLPEPNQRSLEEM